MKKKVMLNVGCTMLCQLVDIYKWIDRFPD